MDSVRSIDNTQRIIRVIGGMVTFQGFKHTRLMKT